MKNLLASCFLLSILIHNNGFSAEASVGDSIEIESDYPVFWYDCVIVGDTLNLVALNSDDDTIDHFQIHDGKSVVLNRIDVADGFQGLEGDYMQLTTDLCLILRMRHCFRKIDLVTGQEQYFLDFDTVDWSSTFIIPEGYYANGSIDCFLFQDYRRDKKSFFAINQATQYSKTYFINMNDPAPRKIQTIQNGRTVNRDFQALLYSDTLYAVWNEWLGPDNKIQFWSSGRKRHFKVFSKYDGRKWHKPIRILELDDYGSGVYESHANVYVIDDRFYLFWRKWGSHDGMSEEGIFYMHSADQREWSPPIKIEGEYDLSEDGSWSTQCVSDGYLHSLIRDGKDRRKMRYCTFNGGLWEDHGVVIDGLTYSGKLRLDDDDNAYVFWTSEEPVSRRLFYRKIELVD